NTATRSTFSDTMWSLEVTNRWTPYDLIATYGNINHQQLSDQQPSQSITRNPRRISVNDIGRHGSVIQNNQLLYRFPCLALSPMRSRFSVTKIAVTVGSQVLKDLEHLRARLHRIEHEMSFLQNIQPTACLLNPDATCDPATLEKASTLIDTIVVEICQRIECRRQVLVLNTPDQISPEHTKTALLTACGMLGTTCTARRQRKLRQSTCCPIMLHFQDENDAVRLLTSLALLWSTEKFRTVKVKAARTRMQRQLTKKPPPSTPPSDALLNTSSTHIINKAINPPIVKTTGASMDGAHRYFSTNHRPPCTTANSIPYAVVPKPEWTPTASTRVDAPVVLLNSQCHMITPGTQPTPNYSAPSSFVALQDPEPSTAPTNRLSALPLMKTPNVSISPVDLSPGPKMTNAIRLQAGAMTTPTVDTIRSRRRPTDLLSLRVPPPPKPPDLLSLRVPPPPKSVASTDRLEQYVKSCQLDERPLRYAGSGITRHSKIPFARYTLDNFQAFSSTLASQDWDDFFLSTNTHRALYPNNHPIACLRFTDSGPVTDPVNIADHLNAYFASCYLPIPPNSEPLLTAASLKLLMVKTNSLPEKPLPPYLSPNYPLTSSTNRVQCAFGFGDDTVIGQRLHRIKARFVNRPPNGGHESLHQCTTYRLKLIAVLRELGTVSLAHTSSPSTVQLMYKYQISQSDRLLLTEELEFGSFALSVLGYVFEANLDAGVKGYGSQICRLRRFQGSFVLSSGYQTFYVIGESTSRTTQSLNFNPNGNLCEDEPLFVGISVKHMMKWCFSCLNFSEQQLKYRKRQQRVRAAQHWKTGLARFSDLDQGCMQTAEGSSVGGTKIVEVGGLIIIRCTSALLPGRRFACLWVNNRVTDLLDESPSEYYLQINKTLCYNPEHPVEIHAPGYASQNSGPF
ncbi:hypothetical protein CLF_108199, partial [Clonorchis sinensis]